MAGDMAQASNFMYLLMKVVVCDLDASQLLTREFDGRRGLYDFERAR